jgi:Ran GTPase-activating protein (RanGAP) involved in mRNA processing and transport
MTDSGSNWISPFLLDIYRYNLPKYFNSFEKGVFRQVCRFWCDAVPLQRVFLTNRWLEVDPDCFYAALHHTDTFATNLSYSLPAALLEKLSRGTVHLRSFCIARCSLSDDELHNVLLALTNCPELRHIDITSNALGPRSASTLTRLIYHSKTLQTLLVGYHELSMTNVKPILDALLRCSSFESLRFGANVLDADSVRSLATLVAEHPTLRALGFFSSISTNSAPLFTAVSSNSTLREFRCQLDAADTMAALSKAIQNHKFLQKLSLQRCSISPEGGSQLCSALCDNSSITSLDLTFTPIADGIRFLGKAIASSSCAITSLTLGAPKATSVAVTAFAADLKSAKTLSELSWRYLGDGVEFGALGEAIASSSSLRSVELEKFECNDADMLLFSNTLAENTSLTFLRMNSAPINFSRSFVLGDALAKNKHLKTLELLSSYHDSYDKLQGLASGLRLNQHLSSLSLKGDLNDHTRKFLIELLAKNTSLQHISINPAGFVAALTEAFFTALLENKKSAIESISIERCETSITAARIFSDLLKDNRPSFRSVDFFGVFSFDQEIQVIAEGLAVNQYLTRLQMRKGLVGTSGAKCLAEALRGNTSLQVLDLSDHCITDGGLDAFVDVMQDKLYKSGQRVILDGNNPSVAFKYQHSKLKHLTRLDLGLY